MKGWESMKSWNELAQHASVIQKSVDELLQKHYVLQSFLDAQEWDNDTRVVIELLQNFEKDLTSFKGEQQKILEQLKQERSRNSIFKKVFSTRSGETEANGYIKKADAAIQSIVDGIELLYGMMDQTPASKSEQKEIASELRLLKKELTFQKREVNESLRKTRSNARQKTANLTGLNSGFIGSVARYQRTSIRLEKERALTPNEDLKAFIEKKLVGFERDLNWVMHFTGEDQNDKTQPASEEVKHCNYCGRRIVTSDVCLGCGSTSY